MHDSATMQRIKERLVAQNAVLVAHFYVDSAIQYLAELTGGCVGDSLEMARFSASHDASTLIVAGVRFMGEAVKILNPRKKVLMPTLAADCSLNLSCPVTEFSVFRQAHADRVAVVYINSSAEVKALADWVVTSSSALKIVKHLHAQGAKILWAPDQYLGDYIRRQTHADMVLWQGSCIVHERFKAQGIVALKKIYPQAGVLVHPEAPAAVIAVADVVGSTSQLLKASQTLPNQIFIVATDSGILYQMQQRSPHKTFISAPTAGHGATCQSCAHCPWMEMNTLAGIEKCLTVGTDEVIVDEVVAKHALLPLQRMLDFMAF